MSFLDRALTVLNYTLIGIAGILLLGIIIVTCGNIIFRAVWVPIDGTFELVGFFGAVLTAFALGYTGMRKSHISIDILVMQYPARVREIVYGVNGLVCGLFFLFCGWRIALWAGTIWKEGEVTQTLGIIYHPFVYSVALGCLVLSLVLFMDFLKIILRKRGA